MQIVIDIPEEEYALCKKQWDTECLDTLMIAVKYGTPLPEGHGRLIDADAMKKHYPIMENDFGMVINESLHRQLDKLPTITEQEIVKPYLDKIKGYVDHIRNTGMGKKKSLEFIEKFIEGLKAESEKNK